MSRPFMPFYDGDWLRDTAHLDDHQERAYFRLVMFYWAAEKLPNDEAQLARIVRMTPAKWRKNREVLAAFFDADWHHKRIEKELEKSRKFLEKQRENGAKPKARREPEESQNETRAPVPQPQPLLAASSSFHSEEAAAPARTRADYDRIENECRKAAGAENNPSPALMSLAPIIGLLDAGFDLEGDILPAIRRKPKPNAGSWNYFLPQIQDHRAERLGAAKAGRKAISESLPRPKDVISDDVWRSRLRGWIDSNYRSVGWMPNWGPQPRRGGCEVPSHILAEFPQINSEAA